IQAFFAQYPEFSYDPSEETMKQFWDMIRQLGWVRDEDRKDEALSGIRDAIAQQFTDIYGGNAGDLGAWQRLWEIVGEGDAPTDIKACRAAVKRVFVNICDLVDFPATQVRPPVFATVAELAEYSRTNRKIYPKENAKAGGLLKTHVNPPAATVTPIQAFFAQHPGFSYDPSGETMQQFWSMMRQFGWTSKGDLRKTEALSGIQDAIAQQFNDIYGGNATDLAAWQRLWEMVGEGDMPTDINACRAAIKRVFVNICDLVDYPATRVPPPRFPTLDELAEYSRDNGKIYPKQNAYAGGLLQFLLRKLLRPSQMRGGSSGRGGRRGLQNVTTTRLPTPIEAFFARYPDYPYDQSRETMSQFWEMSSQFGWGESVRRESLGELRDAIAQQFNDIYGADVNDLQAWQRLCGLVGDGNIPDNIAACRAVIRRVHVNICDLVDYPATTIPPPVFFTESALAKYSRDSGKIFPSKNAYSGGLLRFLLRHIYHPTHNRGISADNGRASGNG
ncbi:hypothetical protein IW261DRAFT_1334956, partial [Armillaria novae-zelandiae]